MASNSIRKSSHLIPDPEEMDNDQLSSKRLQPVLFRSVARNTAPGNITDEAEKPDTMLEATQEIAPPGEFTCKGELCSSPTGDM